MWSPRVVEERFDSGVVRARLQQRVECEEHRHVQGGTVDLLPHSSCPPGLVPARRADRWQKSIRSAPAHSVEAVIRAAAPVETEEVFGRAVGELHAEHDLRVRINSGTVLSDRNLVGESGDGRGEDLSARGPSSRKSREGEEHQSTYHQRDAGEPGDAGQESPAHQCLSDTMLLGFPPEVPNNKGDVSQHHVGHEGKSEENARAVGSSRENQSEGKEIQAGVVGGVERSEGFCAQEEQQKVHHGDYDIVSGQEDVRGPVALGSPRTAARSARASRRRWSQVAKTRRESGRGLPGPC